MRRHVLLTMIIGFALTVPAPLGVAFAQSTGPGTHKDGEESVMGQGLGDERSSERTGSSATVGQGVTGKKKHRKGKARSTRNKTQKRVQRTTVRSSVTDPDFNRGQAARIRLHSTRPPNRACSALHPARPRTRQDEFVFPMA